MKKILIVVLIVTLGLSQNVLAYTYDSFLNNSEQVDVIASATKSKSKPKSKEKKKETEKKEEIAVETKKTKIEKQKEIIKSMYTEKELKNLEQVKSKLEDKYKGIKILPVENILTNNTKFKFDVPPVIKEGRTLIPIRAISEGFDAKVEWNGEERLVSIIKGETKIMIAIGSNIAYINDVNTEIDVPAEIMNDRTVVPLRFVIENMGLNVKWDSENQTIEIIN
ncbi:copper amine oxidase N-terminal domain-containing protein [Wukongibacter baidiensis]|uniref:copper amine oxidase N-terminal domain-containing protein n=1 Tax=Wukongibacter baidiensis TaxID=1723361 RepID=UPI003D7FD42C